MKLSRHATAAALAVAVSLGAGAPVAMAAPHGGHAGLAHAKAHHVKGEHGKSNAKLSRAQRKLAHQVARKDHFLARLLDRGALSRLDDTVEGVVRTNIEGDRTDLAALADLVTASTGEDLGALGDQVRAVRPEVYNSIISQLRQATRLQSALDASAPAPADGTDATAVDPATSLTEVVAELEGLDATATRSQLRETRHTLAQVADAVDGDDADEAGEAEETEPEDGDVTGTDSGDTSTETGGDTTGTTTA
ncbi:MAG TPA: hypothetical protein VF049_02465 [Nocardioidaceae bacterium]|jgi:hypothetical protein